MKIRRDRRPKGVICRELPRGGWRVCMTERHGQKKVASCWGRSLVSAVVVVSTAAITWVENAPPKQSTKLTSRRQYRQHQLSMEYVNQENEKLLAGVHCCCYCNTTPEYPNPDIPMCSTSVGLVLKVFEKAAANLKYNTYRLTDSGSLFSIPA